MPCGIRTFQLEVVVTFFKLNSAGYGSGDVGLAAQALTCVVETAELLPFPIKVDLYGGIYSVFDGCCPYLLNTERFRTNLGQRDNGRSQAIISGSV